MEIENKIMNPSTKSLSQAARDAIVVQSACNLVAVSKAFAEAMSVLSKESLRLGLDKQWINTHPITILFVSQIAHLSESHAAFDFLDYNRAFEACEYLSQNNV